MKKKLLYLIIFLVAIELASAAILHGTIYNTRLNRLNDVIVDVNSLDSESTQRFVSKEGQYSFVLDPGNYKITAKYQLSETNYLYSEDNITIATDSYIKKDLLLKPAKRIEISSDDVNYSIVISIISIILIIALGFTIYKLKFSNKAEEQGHDQSTGDLLKIIREEGGRTTQKDIRKKIPLSEAKISLMISDLESQGILKRIKKGRGNIIIFNKDK